MIERAGCSWQSEDADTAMARRESPDSALFHDGHSDDLSKCDAWLCVCGKIDPHGSWESTDHDGRAMEPVSSWVGHQKCTACGRVYDYQGIAISGSGKLFA